MNHNLANIISPPSIVIADKAPKMAADGIRVAMLQTGEPSFKTPEYISNTLPSFIIQGYTSYCESQGVPLLGQSLSNWYNNRHGRGNSM